MKKYGPQDESYVTLYDAKHEAKVRSKVSDQRWVQNWLNLSKAVWNDHRFNASLDDIEILQVSKAEDLPTLPGLRYCTNLILGISAAFYKFMVVGNDNSQARPYQQNLNGEVTPRVDMSLPGNGSIARSGTIIMRFIGNFPASFPTLTINESGISTAAPGGTFLNRNVYASPSTHTSGVTAFTVTTDITFTIVTTFL